MNIQVFSAKRPFLYHLTDSTNWSIILKHRSLLSTKVIAESSLESEEAKKFLRSKRSKHTTLTTKGLEYKIRDQQPILMTVLERSLSGSLSAEDFIELLNRRVFWWPTLNRLERHFQRYASENPVILKVSTADMFALNKNNIELCHLNSGATRCHPKYGGNAPTRGKESFLKPSLFNKKIGDVAEVTFLGKCSLPDVIWIGSSPEGPWKRV